MRIPPVAPTRQGALRILMRVRSDAFRNPGGDTVLMDRLKHALLGLGHHVDTDPEAAADAGRYDVVHLFNLTLPDALRPLALEADSRGVPFVIHGLQEDWPRFRNRALATAIVLEKYVASGQSRSRLVPALEMARQCPAAVMPICPEASLAASILCTGNVEADLVRKFLPGTRTDVVRLGAWDGMASQSPESPDGADTGAAGDFRRAFGVDEFVLCVGRLEPRKNQLMLLAALEEEDLTIVFADGGYNYDPGYAEACRRFARRGRTLFTGKLPATLLRSAYAGARVCCLPSWYELPGLATLEAALRGRNVVAGAWGTIQEYLAEGCAYVEPDDFAGLRAALLNAWDSPPNAAMRKRASAFTWAACAQGVEKVYRDAVARRSGTRP